MTVGQSQFVKNGQQIKTLGGSVAIAQGALTIVGGPGVETWPAVSTDYSARASAGPISAATQVVSSAVPGQQRQGMARDRLGNIYLVGTNGSGRLVAYKFDPSGTAVTSAVLDSSATSVNSPQLHQLQSGAFVCVYARAAGALMFVIFDAALNRIAGPSSVATEYASTNVVYHSSVALSGGGFAIVYQASDGATVKYVTYGNTGSNVVAAVTIQTLASSTAQEYLKLAQISSGNLVCGLRGTMTAGGTAGINFVMVNPAGTVVAGPTNLDSTSVLGLLEISTLPGGGYALAGATGANLVAAVYDNNGTRQGPVYSVGDTLNSTTYPQVKLCNDGTQFWLAWFSSAANGIYVIAISSLGVTSASASALAGSTLSASTFALDADVINGFLACFAASSSTGGQYLVLLGLPDASLGISAPYLYGNPVSIGSAAGTTGSNGPRLLSGGAGFYRGSSPPAGQPSFIAGCGDFVAILAYDHQNTASTLIAVQKIVSSAIVGICQSAVAAGSPGQAVTINPGPGEYPTQQLAGTFGVGFNHLTSSPVGTSGALYGLGAGLSGVQQGAGAISDRVGIIEDFAGPEDKIPASALLCIGTAISRTGYAALFAKIGTTWGVGDGTTTFNIPNLKGYIRAGADDMGGVDAGNLGGNPSAGGIAGVASLGTRGGAKDHTPILSETAAHTHTYTKDDTAASAGSGGGPVYGNQVGDNTGSAGGGDPFNITQPTACVNTIIYFA